MYLLKISFRKKVWWWLTLILKHWELKATFSHICYNKNYTFIKMYCMVREEIYTQAYITIIDYIFIIDYIRLLITSLYKFAFRTFF